MPPEEVREAVRLFAKEKPSSYCTWVGLEQDRDAMQTNRAVCIFYALTGQFDQRGSNVLFATTPTNPINGRELLPKEQAMISARPRPNIHLARRLIPGSFKRPGLRRNPHGQTVSRKGANRVRQRSLLGHGDPLRGKAALESLEFYIHVDTTINPSAMFADLILPGTTCWERQALLPSFEIAEDTLNWAQLRPAIIKPLHESRSDIEIVFDLAKRLELSDHFFNGDIGAGFDYQLAPSGLSTHGLREYPGGIRADVQTRYRKYAEIEAASRQPHGFETPSGKIEIYSTTFADEGYAPLPKFVTKQTNAEDQAYPLTLTFFRDIHFCDEQHRNIPQLRRALPDPFLEIHPSPAMAQGIHNGAWISLETANGKVKLKAKFNESLHPSIVATVYGWWQSCKDLDLPGHNPFSKNGANLNLLVPNADADPISASVAHRGQRCRVVKIT